MIARLITYLLIGGLLVAAVAVAAPEYLAYLWIFFGLLLIIALLSLVVHYVRKMLKIVKEEKRDHSS
ncbi:hypothetical protein CEY16_01200 [Halalkalibacillus sediminis]|uniref:Uncharacterized protein n=1 Tax=Halalkalibacillus sediminis TaxID=2018042 RepID=A0A2I0QVN0_9BACI|nr:hypothetical protein [Halalkalibacillus sediminis]PKR78402.1 hypothetical protein CEY16_01200 [Halalkalibacillus sediminis]